MHLSFPLLAKQTKRHKIRPVAGTSTATHTFHFLPNYDDNNHYYLNHNRELSISLERKITKICVDFSPLVLRCSSAAASLR
jgi:hypothetical protein